MTKTHTTTPSTSPVVEDDTRANPAAEAAQTAVTQVDPRTLLIDANVRLDARADKDFTASIRDLGVLAPIIALTTTEGALRVRMGHRRTLAAIEAGHATVPVIVVGAEDESDAGQVERLLTQYAENEHRTGLSQAEHVSVVAQLAAFGVTPAQIAKRTRMARPRVDAALTVEGSVLAKAATARYELTIDQAVVLAEFEEDTETVTALVAAAQTGQFDHVAQRARDKRTEQAEYDAEHARLTQAGIRVIDRTDLGLGKTLTNLTDEPGSWDRLPAEEHTGCPGHAALLERQYSWDLYADDDTSDDSDESDESDTDDGEEEREPVAGYRWVPVWVCTDPAGNGHSIRGGDTRSEKPKVADMDEEQRDAARAERRDVIESNKAWASAETVRREWLQTYLTRKTAPKGTATFLATAHAQDSQLLNDMGGHDLASYLLDLGTKGYGRRADLAATIAAASDARAQVIHLGLVLAAYEDHTDREHWRTANPATGRYLTHIASLGYALSDVEQRAVPHQ